MDDRLRKTVLVMLSSSHAGEVAAARDAILKVAGADIHGLADAFGAALVTNDDSEEISHQQMAQRCSDWNEIRGGLSEKECKFVTDMLRWGRPTEKQLAWLVNIYEKMKENHERAQRL